MQQIVQSEIIKGAGLLPHAVVLRRCDYPQRGIAQYIVHIKTWRSEAVYRPSHAGYSDGWYGRAHHEDTGEHLRAAMDEYTKRCRRLGLDSPVIAYDAWDDYATANDGGAL